MDGGVVWLEFGMHMISNSIEKSFKEWYTRDINLFM